MDYHGSERKSLFYKMSNPIVKMFFFRSVTIRFFRVIRVHAFLVPVMLVQRGEKEESDSVFPVCVRL